MRFPLPARSRLATVGACALVALLAACSPGDDTNTGTGPTPPVPGIRLTVPTSLSVRQGATVVVPITIARTDYTSVVGVTFSGLPRGVAAPTVSTTSTNAFSIPLVADTSAAVGTAQVTVTGQGIDIPTQTATFALTVTAR
ncbi:MAG: hypothetical protein MUE41_04230 [Gemmatimonadaceae bacterium]|nr:hypothetical protein [Gemmatimonadaceae bacterium]